MTMPITLTTAEGQSYSLQSFDPHSTTWHHMPAIYAFGRFVGAGIAMQPEIFYIGECGDMAVRMAGHTDWPDAVVLGADRIFAMVLRGDEASRKAVEKALIRAYCPPLNEQHNWLAAMYPSSAEGLRAATVVRLLKGIGRDAPTPPSPLAGIFAGQKPPYVLFPTKRR